MKQKEEYLRRITLEAKLLLLLNGHLGSEDLVTVPDVITQGGMAREFRIRRNNISRSLSELSGRGYIRSRTKHIKGLQRRRKAYFLTEEGINEAQSVIRDISPRLISVRNLEGALVEWTFERLRKEISTLLHRNVLHYEVISGYLDDEICDLNSLMEGEKEIPVGNIPMVGDVFGRENEIGLISRALEDKVNLISIIGIAGIGKTTLVAEAVTKIKKTVIWKDLDPWMSPDILLDELESHSSGHRTGSLSGRDKYRRSRVLSKSYASSGSIVVLDDVHRCGKEMRDLLSIFVDLSRKDGWTLILLSRVRPPLYTISEALSTNKLLEITLSGLEMEGSIDLMKALSVPENEMEDIYRTTEGHPLAISLCSLNPGADSEILMNSFKLFLRERVLSELGKKENELMELLSAFDLPIDPRSLDIDDVISTVRDLSNRALLITYPDGSLDLHDSIREGIRETMSRERFQELRGSVREHYRKGSSDTDMVQFLMLTSELSDKDELLGSLLEHGDYLVGRGFLPVARLSLSKDLRPEDPQDIVRLEVLRYDSSLLLGNEDDACKHLKRAGSRAEALLRSSRDPRSLELTVIVLNRLAERALREGLHRDVIQRLGKGLELARDAGARDQEARLLSNIGTAYMDLGDPDTAGRFFSDSLDIFTDIGDTRGESITRLNMGGALSRTMDLPGALRQYLECIRVSRKDDLIRISSQASFRVGKLYSIVKEGDEAVKYFDEAAVGYARIGDIDYSLLVLSKMAVLPGSRPNAQDMNNTVERIVKVIKGGGFGMIKQLFRTRNDRLDSDLNILTLISDSYGGERIDLKRLKAVFETSEEGSNEGPQRLRKDILRIVLLRDDAKIDTAIIGFLKEGNA